jgi:hypothetical protein
VAKLVGSKLKTVAEGLFQVIPSRSSKDELVVLCEQPRCGDQSGNRSINIKTGKTNCWRCGVGGDFLNWIKTLGHDPDLSDISLYDTTTLDDAMKDLDAVYATKRSVMAVTNDIKLPRGFRPLAEHKGTGYAKMIERMAVRKHLDIQTFERVGAGFTMEDPRWEPFCIFPVFEYGRVVYYQGRTYTDPKPDPVTGKKASTKQFPTKYEIPLGSRYWVYNIDKLRAPEARVGIVVESMFNVYSLENELQSNEVIPVAIFKHKISAEQQAKMLTARGIKELCLMFDPDAIASAWDSCKKLTNIIKVTVAPPLPKGTDPNDDAKAAVKTFEQRKPFSSINSLERLVLDL